MSEHHVNIPAPQFSTYATVIDPPKHVTATHPDELVSTGNMEKFRGKINLKNENFSTFRKIQKIGKTFHNIKCNFLKLY